MRNVKKTSVLALATLILSTAGALAVDGVATGAVNVRTGPGPSYAKVDTLYAGEEVDVGQCQGSWCYITHSGPDGWVSKNYLAFGGGTPPSQPSATFCIQFPMFSGCVNSGGGGSVIVTPPPPPPPTPTVCIYDGANYTGAQLCGPAGSSNSMLAGFWNDRISSLKISGGAHIKLCQNPNYLGFCNTFSSDVPMLGVPLNNKASSYQSW
jgi:hypothetical protein